MSDASERRGVAVLALVVVLAGVVFVGLGVGTVAAESTPECDTVTFEENGDGALEVSTAAELQCIGDENTNGDLGDDYVLTGDIDLTAADVPQWDGGNGFDPIGEEGEAFTGTFDGQGNTITGLTIDRNSATDVGLFGRVSGTVERIHLENVDIRGGGSPRIAPPAGGLGGLVGVLEGGVLADATVSGSVDGQDNTIGGAVGWVRGGINAGEIRNTTASGSVEGDREVGGLVGNNDGVVHDSSASTTVHGMNEVGGFVGHNSAGEVHDSYATGDVTGNSFVGGLVGWINSPGKVTNTYATGDVSGSNTDRTGGLLGVNSGEIADSYWDRGTTNQDDGIGDDSGTSTTIVGFGDPSDTGPASEMTGDDASENMNELAFDTVWETVAHADVDATEDSYPILTANERQFQLEAFGVNEFESVKDWHDLDDVRNDLDGDYILVNNLDSNTAGYDEIASETANDGKGFEPIGNDDRFTGTFDGDGHTISDLYINRTETVVGLFGEVGEPHGEQGIVTNVSLEDANVTGDSNVGGLVGTLSTGEVSDSAANATVSATDWVAGGLVGQNFGEVRNSHASGTVYGSQSGGFIGQNSGEVTDSYATGDVDDTDGFGLVGGLVGDNDGELNRTYATGTVVSDDGQVGGLVGFSDSDSQIHSSFATGDVAGDSDVGGLIGDNGGDVSNSYSAGQVTGDSDVGGFAGSDWGTIEDSYWDSERSSQSDSAGDATGLQTFEMIGETPLTTMTAFDYDGTWQVVTAEAEGADDDGYPVLIALDIEPQILIPEDFESPFAGGDGTIDDPYQIEDWNHLRNARVELDANFRLNNDLNENTDGYETHVNTNEGFEPIGSSNPFTGTFDGTGHTISGLYVNQESEDNMGLFAEIGEDGFVKNVALEDVNVTGNMRVGGLAGSLDGTTTGVSVTGNVTGDGSNVGGLAGQAGGTVTDTTADVAVVGDHDVGGLIGDLTAGGDVGGSAAFGNVTAVGNVGGLVGVVDDGAISESYATGGVNSDSSFVGGLVGIIAAGEISESYATGSVNSGWNFVGGLVGQSWNSEIDTSYATGAVSGDMFVGGFVGSNVGSGKITLSYAVGAVSGEDTASTGGFAGENDATIEDSYWDTESTGQSDSDGGEGLTTAEKTGLDAPVNMTALEFPDGDGMWHVTDSYPALAWEDTGPFYEVTIEGTNSPVDGGDTLEVTTTVTNWAADGEQTVTLSDTDFSNEQQDSDTVPLDSGEFAEPTLEWATKESDAGTGDVTVASENDAAIAEVTVESVPESEDDESESDSGSGGGSGAEADAGGDTDNESTADGDGDETDRSTVSVEERIDEQTGDRTVRVTITNSIAGSVVRLDNTSTPTGGAVGLLSNISVDSISMSMVHSREYTTLNITSYESNVATRDSDGSVDDPSERTGSIAETARGFESTTGSISAGYVEVEHNFEENDLDSVSIEYSIRKSYLNTLGTAAEDVSLIHTSEGTEWSELPTEQTGENATHYRFESEAPGFSVFAIDTGVDAVTVGDSTLDRERVEIGESVTVSTTVRNRGTVTAEQTLSLLVDGETAEVRTFPVSGGSVDTAELRFSPEKPGTYTLAINDQRVGEVNAESAADSDDSDGMGAEEPAGEDRGSVLIAAVLAGAVVLIAGVYWRRRRVSSR